MTGGRVDRLGLARRRAVAQAVTGDAHHWRGSFSGTGRGVGWNTADPATSRSGSACGVLGGVGRSLGQCDVAGLLDKPRELGNGHGCAIDRQAVHRNLAHRRTMASPIRLTPMIEKDVGHDRAVLARRRRSHAPAAVPAWPVPPLAPALRAFGGAARRWVSSSSPRQTAIRRPARAEWQLTRAMRE